MQSLQQFRVTANSGTPLSNGFIWLIDISIGLGVGKILTVLALDAHHHCKNSGAPTFRPPDPDEFKLPLIYKLTTNLSLEKSYLFHSSSHKDAAKLCPKHDLRGDVI